MYSLPAELFLNGDLSGWALLRKVLGTVENQTFGRGVMCKAPSLRVAQRWFYLNLALSCGLG